MSDRMGQEVDGLKTPAQVMEVYNRPLRVIANVPFQGVTVEYEVINYDPIKGILTIKNPNATLPRGH